MNKVYIFSIMSVLLYCCNNNNNVTEENSSVICKNESDLLCSFDSLPALNCNLKYLNVDIDQKLSQLFHENICCKDLRFNVYQNVGPVNTKKLCMNYYCDCDGCPAFVRLRYVCNILQNSKGQVLFEGKCVPIDSLDDEIFSYYSKVGHTDVFPNSYDKVNFALEWDLSVNDSDFIVFISQVIKGYLSFANQLSEATYSKKICDLEMNELKNFGNLIPLRIELSSRIKSDSLNDSVVETN